MTLMIKSWFPAGVCGTPTTGSPCDPCPPPPPPPPDGGGLPFFTTAVININQYEVYTSTSGEVSYTVIGQMIIYSGNTPPPQGAFGVPAPLGPIEYGFVSAYVLYKSAIQITHPWYPPGSYDGSLPDITAGQIGTPTGNPVTDAANTASFQAASVASGNAAIAQANHVLGNP